MTEPRDEENPSVDKSKTAQDASSLDSATEATEEVEMLDSPTEIDLGDADESEMPPESGSTEPQKTGKNKLYRTLGISFAVLLGALLVGGVVGYFTLMEKLGAGTLEEVAQRLPADTKSVVVFRGAGELGSDFLDVLLALPEDPDNVATIEEKYGIDLSSPLDLYATGIDPFRAFAVAIVHSDVRLKESGTDEAALTEDLLSLDIRGDKSVVAFMIPVHDEQDAMVFAHDLLPLLHCGDGTSAATTIEFKRDTAEGAAWGDSCAAGVESEYLIVIWSGDPAFKAKDELKRIMRVEPAKSLWQSEAFAQQVALTDESWNMVFWSAPSMGEKAITEFVSEKLKVALAPAKPILESKIDLDELELGAISSVSHLSTERGRFRMVYDLSTTMKGDPVWLNASQQGEAVGTTGIFTLVSGSPLVAMRVTIDMEYLWTDWLSNESFVQEQIQMLPPSMIESVIENMTGNITVAVMARDEDLAWSEGSSVDDLPALLPGVVELPYQPELVLGVEFRDAMRLVPEFEAWGIQCEEAVAGISWCQSDDSSAMGLTATHLIYASGHHPKDKIQTVALGQRDNFFSNLTVGREELESGPDLQVVLFLEEMTRLENTAYFNSDIVRWFKIVGREEILDGLTSPVLSLLAHPPAPGLVGEQLDHAVAPILEALRVEAEIKQAEADILSIQEMELKSAFDPIEAAWRIERDAIYDKDPDASFTRSPEHQALLSEKDAVTQANYDADLRARSLLRNAEDLENLVSVIQQQATTRLALGQVSPVIGTVTAGMQVWEDSSLVMDLNLYPSGEDFVSVLLSAIAAEVAER